MKKWRNEEISELPGHARIHKKKGLKMIIKFQISVMMRKYYLLQIKWIYFFKIQRKEK